MIDNWGLRHFAISIIRIDANGDFWNCFQKNSVGLTPFLTHIHPFCNSCPVKCSHRLVESRHQ